MADRFIYEMSQLTDVPESPMLKKEVIYIQDQNNSSTYNAQINYDFSQVSNSYKWVDWGSKQTVLEIPFTILVESLGADIDTVATKFIAGLKAGTHQLVNSVSVTINNSQCVQLSNYQNHYVTYKHMTEMSQEELKKWGASTYFAPDNVQSFKYVDTAGIGMVNNTISTAGDLTTNTGFTSRLENVVDIATDTLLGMTNPSLTSNGISFYSPINGKPKQVAIYILATLQLSSVADLFKELPLLKGTFVTMIVNVNASTQLMTLSAGKIWNVKTGTSPQITGLSNPIMISSGLAGQPNNALPAGEYRVTCNVGSVFDSTGTEVPNPLLYGRTRLSLALYTLNPIFEQRYLSQKTKTVYYTDFYSYLNPNVLPGTQFNFLASNGISQPTSVIVIPYLSKGVTTLTNQLNVPTYQSPLTSEPGTPSPMVITNFNIAISGANIFQSNFDYDYQAWLTELASTGLNGGETVLTSGLLSQKDFTYGYRYYIADLSRRLPNDDIARSIQVSGKNASDKAMDILVIIPYQRKLVFSLETGGIVPTVVGV